MDKPDGKAGKNDHDCKIPWVTLKLDGKKSIFSADSGKIDHKSKIRWASLEMNGQTWNLSGISKKIDYIRKIPWTALKLNGKVWNLPGKSVNFLEIDGKIIMSRQKFRSPENSRETAIRLLAINKIFFEMDEIISDVYKILKLSLQKFRCL